jgi:hypothetical protein
MSDANWEQLLPRLVAYADQCLRRVGWADGHDQEPSPMSVKQAINIAIERCLDGSRRWNDDDPPEFGAFLCGVIRSIISDERKKVRRSKLDFDEASVAGAADPRSDGDGQSDGADEGRTAICAAVEACTRDDEALESFYLAVLDGHTKREDIAAALGWTPDAVTAARVKLQRRLLKKFPQEFASAKARRRSS